MKLSLALPAMLVGSATTSFAFAPRSSTTHHHQQRCRDMLDTTSSSSFARTMSYPPKNGGGEGNNNSSSPAPAKSLKKVLTAADVMAKSKSRQSSMTTTSSITSTSSSNNDASSPSIPQIFSPQIYADFQSTLLLLEKRINNNSGSLSRMEVELFEEQTARIVMEMNEYLKDPEGKIEAIRKSYQEEEGDANDASDFATSSSIAATAAAAASRSSTASSSSSASGSTTFTTTTTATTTNISSSPPLLPLIPASNSNFNQEEEEEEKEIVVAVPTNPVNSIETYRNNNSGQNRNINYNDDIDDDDKANEEYTNFGLARGTTNTYVIPGMEEMSPEEYRTKLQETISARQAERRRQSLSSGIIGNRSSTGYLDGLSRVGGSGGDGGGSSGVKNDGDGAVEVGWGGGAMYKRQQGENSPRPIVDDDDDDSIAANSEHVLNGAEEGNDGSSSTTEETQRSITVEKKGGLFNIEEPSNLSVNATPMRRDVEHPQRQHSREQIILPQSEVLAPSANCVSFDESQIFTMRQIKLNEESRRKSEWRVDDTALATIGEGSDELFEQAVIVVGEPKLPRSVINKEETIISPSPTSEHGSDSFNIDGWWGNQQRRQRPIPASIDHRKGSFFQVHTVPTLAEKTIQASERVSTESTQSFAHGNEENSLRQRTSMTSTKSTSAGDNPLRFFRVHDDTTSASIAVDDVKSPRKKFIKSSVKSLIEMEERVRPIPSTISPEYFKLSDHRDVGDGVDPRRNQKPPTPKSLVGTEERIRPVAPSDFPEYTKIKDHRSTGDTKIAKRSKLLVHKSLIESERRVRPIVLSSSPHEHTEYAGHRSTGDTKVTQRRKFSTITNVSLIETEGRVRPVISSSHLPEYAKVRDQRCVGDTRKTVTRSRYLPPLVKSLIGEEKSIRPISSSSSSYSSSIDQNLHTHVIDHRGPGDDNALTRRAQQQPMPISLSLSESEQRARPIPSSYQFQDIQVGDHRGPGDANALTKRTESTSSSCSTSDPTSLSADEQRQRPVPTFGLSQSQVHQVGDYRGPGDTSRTITEKLQSRLSSNDSGTEDGCWWDESTQRPTTLYLSDTSRHNQHALRKIMLGDTNSSLSQNMPPSKLKSLLKEEKKDFLSKRHQKQAMTDNPPPIAAILPSSLRSLLKDDERSAPDSSRDNVRNPQHPTQSEEKPTSLSSSSKNLSDQWWNEKPQRPRNYVKHFQPMNASYTRKVDPPRDYGDAASVDRIA